MKITVWSDFVCPFCYIGTTHLEQALENFAHADEVSIEFKSFQLEPDAEYEPEKSFMQAMADRKGTSVAEMQKMHEQVDEMAKKAGLNYNFDEMKLTDTYPAHRVFQYAKEKGVGVEYYDKFYQAYFTDGKLISDPDVIVNISKEVGLDEKKVRDVLEDHLAYDQEVKEDIRQAAQVGARGVPFFVFNNKYAVSGAQPVEVFEQVLSQVHTEFAENSEA